MKQRKFETMPLDELWKLHDEVVTVLTSKVEAQKREIERQLDKLGRRFGGAPKDLPQPRPYPMVLPKYRNPNIPTETWSGRGRQPHWVIAVLANGMTLDDCRIQ
jgi:DNA-binding protein H-NS